MFEVGDLVIGTKESDHVYGYTNTSLICEVFEIRAGGFIVVGGVASAYGKDRRFDSGHHTVESKYFEKYKTNKYEVELI